MTVQIKADDVAALISNHSRVFIQGGTGQPSDIVTALSQSTTAPHKAVNYTSISIPGINNFSPQTFHQGASFSSFFIHSQLRQSGADTLHYYPLHYRDIFRFLKESPCFDIAIFQLSPPNNEGRCSFGLSADFADAVIANSRCIIAEINQQMPYCQHSPSIEFSAIDYAVDTDHPLPEPEPALDGEIERAIARHAAGLIEDGSCLQFGIGKIPGQILKQLHGHRQLGLHSGMISDEARQLIEAGVITGEAKSIDRHLHVAGIAYGSRSLYDWAGSQKQLHLRPVSYTHDNAVIQQLDRFVSINSALQIDLLGQANAECVAGRTVSSTGGLVDFVRGARASRGGKSIIALPASARAGQHSRIVNHLDQQAVSTLCRADIDHVVTEYGSANLFGLDTERRACALIDIAHPAHRDTLWQQWQSSYKPRL
ncbi:acetyl-CoA hydrolase/transferase family protein [Spongiibacter marinus]|uniref:acetyl-CoA hydrolase/transferase family protein n=1 Tax=Spongiibacter marinus TaxID=354246 RepID=UPI0035BE6D9D